MTTTRNHYLTGALVAALCGMGGLGAMATDRAEPVEPSPADEQKAMTRRQEKLAAAQAKRERRLAKRLAGKC